MKKLKVSVIHGGICPPRADPSMYNPSNYQTNLQYFHGFLQRRGSSANTISSHLTSARRFHNLYRGVTVKNLQSYKAQLMERYKPSTMNTRVYEINQYATTLQSDENISDTGSYAPAASIDFLESYKPPSVRHQQKPFLNNVISKRGYEHLKHSLKRDNNIFWYFVVRFLGATGVRVSELIQIKAEYIQIDCMDLYSKGGRVRHIYFPEKLYGEMLSWLDSRQIQTGSIFTNRRGNPITPRDMSSRLKVLAKGYRICLDTIYPRLLRRRSVENFLTRFNDASFLADLMSHESIGTTRIYLARSSDEQRELIDKIVTQQIVFSQEKQYHKRNSQRMVYTCGYTWYQWPMSFFIYCFFGWISESTYVSAKTGHFVDYDLLRLPLLPLYGTGAVMMLWVFPPVKDNLFPMYLAGIITTTILEYAIGWGMEKLFEMKYWDYSNQGFNVKGHICLSSLIVQSFLTIFLAEVVYHPIEHYVLGLPVMANIILVLITSLLSVADTAESIRTALDLAEVLDAMTGMRAELDDIQVQMALLKAEISEHVAEAREEAAAKLSRMKSGTTVRAITLKDNTTERLNELMENTMEKMSRFMESAAGKMGGLVENTAERVARTAERLSELTEDAATRVSGMLAQRIEGSRQAIQRDELNKNAVQDRKNKLAALSQRLISITEKRHMLSTHTDFYRRGILRDNPTVSPSRFAEALKELRETADRKSPDEHNVS